MRIYSPIVTALLLIAIAFNVYQCDKASDSQTSKFDANRAEQEISELKARETDFKALAKLSSDSLKIMREKSRVAVTAKKARNTATDQRAEVLRVPVQHLIDSIASLQAFVAAQDTSKAQKDSLIVQLETDAFNQAKTASNEILNLHNALEVADSSVVVLETNLGAMEIKLDKERRKRFSVGPNAGYSVTKDGLSPTVGISLQWSIWRF